MSLSSLRERILRPLFALGLPLSSTVSGQPIRQCPENPRYFEWRGQPVALISSAEHYGAVLNRRFDYVRYLKTLQRDGMNYTRIFAGTYVEPSGAFSIQRNTLAPEAKDFLAPWERAQSEAPGQFGLKFDLDHFSSAYLKRLKSFLGEAGRRGIVVEITLFSSIYGQAQWAVNPLNPDNNIQAIPVPDWRLLHTSEAPGPILALQEKLVRWLARELRDCDNCFFEIQNEPWSDNHTIAETLNPLLDSGKVYPNVVEVATAKSVAWQRLMAAAITDEERSFEFHHLIAQNVANFRLAVGEADVAPETAILNFHYAHPEAVLWNPNASQVLGYDESGFSGREDFPYCVGAWRFIFAGGGLFNSLDYSFSVGHEGGDDLENRTAGGGGPTLRAQLKILSDFLHGFDLTALRPTPEIVTRSPGVVPLALGEPGKRYGVHLLGRGPTKLTMKLPSGRYQIEWVNPVDGSVAGAETITSGEGDVAISSPDFAAEMAVRITRE